MKSSEQDILNTIHIIRSRHIFMAMFRRAFIQVETSSHHATGRRHTHMLKQGTWSTVHIIKFFMTQHDAW